MEGLNLKIQNDVAILEFDQPDSKVNILTSEAMADFSKVLDQLATDYKDKVKILLITSKKDGIFIAGANIKEIEGITTETDAIAKADMGKNIFAKLEALPFLTIAVINGACLGGGLELALACKYRVANFSDKVKVGLPEVKLGILPGFGGCIRLPKVVGLTKSLGMILPGKILDGKSALRDGLIDKLFSDVTLVEDAAAYAHEILAGKSKRKPKKKKAMEKFLEDTSIGRSLVFSQAKKGVLKETKGHYPAPLEALKTVQGCFGKSLKAASQVENEGFARLAGTAVSKNLIRVFYLDEEFRKVSWTANDLTPGKVTKCAVVGAGVMGGGIAQLLSHKNIACRVKDIQMPALLLAMSTARKVYSYLLKKRKMKPADVERHLHLISPTLDYSGFKSAEVVIEAVVEDLGIKKKVFQELDNVTAPEALLLSNTSSLPIAEMAAVTKRPDKVAGFHFFNPVHRMPLLEIITTEKTSPQTLATAVAFARKLGKMVIVVKDSVGFLVNRVLLPYMNEAAYLLEEGLSIEELDRVAKKFGMPMGPMELADEVGIDVGYKVAKILEDGYGERMKVAEILHKIKELKMYGKKTGSGFYVYKDKEKTINPAIAPLLKGAKSEGLNADMALRRMIYIMINEASRCLEEKVVDRPHTVDVGMIYGTGFPPFRGGLLRYADSIGIRAIVDDLHIFEQRFGNARFKPSQLLENMAKENRTFYAK